MLHHQIQLRQARLPESDRIAEIARISRAHFLPYLPDLHSLEGDRKFYRNRVFPSCEVWVAEYEGQVVGFCAFREGWVDHLYLLPGFVGQNTGAALLNKAMQAHDHLQLWVFQKNHRAISFYRRMGFQLIRETDGSGNEEKLPDALLEWRG